jgi:hypothetical protein
MPGRITRLKAGTREIHGIEQSFEIDREDWNVYKLLEGGEVRLKTTVHKIYRLVDADGNLQVDENGEAVYFVRHKSDSVFSE